MKNPDQLLVNLLMLVFFTLCILMICINVHAEEQTLFKGLNISHGGFGSPSVKVSQIKNSGEVFAGLHGAWIINHTLSLGIGGYGLVTPISTTIDGTNKRLHMGYGGFEIGYIYKSDSLLHLNLITLIGAGGIGYRNGYEKDDDCNDECDYDPKHKGDCFFVIEPMLFLELNIATWFRACLGGGYRHVSELDNIPGYSSKDLSGPSVAFLLKFGKF